MEKQFIPKKNWLDLNIDDSSEDQQTSTNHQELKYQKIYCQLIDDQSYVGRRDAFSATKVSKGFFVNENADQQFYNYEVKEKVSSITQNKSAQKTDKTIKNINDKKVESINQKSFSQTPTKSQNEMQQLHMQNNENSDSKNKFPQKSKQQKQTERKSRMFHLNLSDSSQDGLPDSQDQKQIKESHEQNENHNTEIGNNEQNHKIEQLNKDKVTNKQDTKSQFIKLNDFKFEKQPQYQVLDQIPKSQRLRAFITRSSSGLNMLWPQFEVKLYYNGLSLLQVKKQPFSISSTYKIYTKLISDKIRYFGRIQSNLAKDFYQIYISENNNLDILRAEIYFEAFPQQHSQPRYFTVYLLKNQVKASDLLGFESFNKISLRKFFQSHENKDKILKLQTRKPIFSQQLKGYVLNFSGRISQASIKNFILEDTQTKEELIMFGRLNKDHFKLQISNPLNCVIGTAITMVQFESRLMQ